MTAGAIAGAVVGAVIALATVLLLLALLMARRRRRRCALGDASGGDTGTAGAAPSCICLTIGGASNSPVAQAGSMAKDGRPVRHTCVASSEAAAAAAPPGARKSPLPDTLGDGGAASGKGFNDRSGGGGGVSGGSGGGGGSPVARTHSLPAALSALVARRWQPRAAAADQGSLHVLAVPDCGPPLPSPVKPAAPTLPRHPAAFDPSPASPPSNMAALLIEGLSSIPSSDWGSPSNTPVGVSPLPNLDEQRQFVGSPPASPSPASLEAPLRPASRSMTTPLMRGCPHLQQPDASPELYARMMRTSCSTADGLSSGPASPSSTGLLPAAGAARMDVGGVQWTQGAMIDRGANGAVYVGHDLNGGLIAIKVQPLPSDSDLTRQRLLLQELNTLQTLKHANVVEYLGSAMDERSLYIFMSYEPQCLAKLLKKDGLSEGVVRKYTRQILLGLQYIHSQGVVHRDIKAANLLIDREGVVKLADFGAANVLQPRGGGSARRQSITGTPHWMSPEMCLNALGQGAGYDGAKGDVWSLGVTVVEMMMGAHPWSKMEGLQAIWQVVNSVGGFPRPPHASPVALDFLDGCLQRDPARRSTVDALLGHAFVAVQGDSPGLLVRRTPPSSPSSGSASTGSSSAPLHPPPPAYLWSAPFSTQAARGGGGGSGAVATMQRRASLPMGSRGWEPAPPPRRARLSDSSSLAQPPYPCQRPPRAPTARPTGGAPHVSEPLPQRTVLRPPPPDAGERLLTATLPGPGRAATGMALRAAPPQRPPHSTV